MSNRCIETWLSSGSRSKCPQCNAFAAKKDIRVLFVKNLTAVDTTERDELRKQLEEERFAKCVAIEKETKAQLSYSLALAEINLLKQQIARLESSRRSNAVPEFNCQHVKFKQSINFSSDIQARCLDFDGHLQMFVMGVSKQLGNSRNYGIAKASFLDARIQYTKAHDGIVKCIRASPHLDGTVLSTSFDKTIKLTSLHTSSIMLSYALEAPGWSCDYHPQDRNIICAGLANGTILLFDVRNTRQALNRFQAVLGECVPVHSLYCQNASSEGSSTLFLGGTVQGPFLVSDGFCNHVRQFCSSMTSLSKTDFAILSTKGPKPEYYIMDRDRDTIKSINLLPTVDLCKYPQPNMIKPSIIALPKEDDYLFVLPDGPSAILVRRTDGQINGTRTIFTNNSNYILQTVCGRPDQDSMVIGLMSERQLNIFFS